MRQLITSTQLDTWFTSRSRDAQEVLPHLIRKLIYAITDQPLQNIEYLRFPVGDDVNRPGYDGRALLKAGSTFTPQGFSVWETGTGGPQEKAEQDYVKRTAAPGEIDVLNTTFVFVTPHPWNGKDGWVAKKKEQNEWRDVRAYDNADLEHWLEICPSVARWLAREMGIPIEGVSTADAYFAETVSAQYGRVVPMDLVVGGRTDSIEQLETWLKGSLREIHVEGESVEEACSFLAASGNSMRDPAIRELYGELALMVDSAEGIEFLSSTKRPHIVIPVSVEAARRAKALAAPGWRLLLPSGRPPGRKATATDVIRLGKLHRSECEGIVRKMGFNERESRRIGGECKGSLTGLLWMVSRGIDRPLPWLSGKPAQDLIPLLFAGQWVSGSKDDQDIIAALAGRKYVEIEALAAEWSTSEGPLVRRADVWDWRAWDFAWQSLAPVVDEGVTRRFIEVALKVLSIADPKFELKADDRWAASVYRKQHPISGFLRDGLIASIVQLALNDEALPIGRGKDVANLIVAKLLSGELFPRKVAWCSLSPWLPDFAEAAPDVFLGCVEDFTRDTEAVSALFEEGGLFGGSPHTHLLWALERLAWSPDYFARSVITLGHLAAVDPGGKLSNRPTTSLREILLPALPQTRASSDERLGALVRLYDELPEVGWNVAASCLPDEPMGMVMSTASPIWRDWKPESVKRPSAEEFWAFVERLLDFMIARAPAAPSRWKKLASFYFRLRTYSTDQASHLLAALETVEPQSLTQAERAELTEKIDDLLGRTKEFESEKEPLSQEEESRLHRICEKLRPDDVVQRYKWLFTAWPRIPGEHKMPYEKREMHVRSEQQKVVASIFNASGQDGVLSFATQVEQPGRVGAALAAVELDVAAEVGLLAQTLQIDPSPEGVPAALQVGLGYVQQKYHLAGDTWLDSVVGQQNVKWTPTMYANLGWALPCRKETWDRMAFWGSETESLYWTRTPVQFVEVPKNDLEFVLRRLIQHDRIYRAIDIAGLYLRTGQNEGRAGDVSPDLLVELLDKAIKHDRAKEWYAPVLASKSHDIAEILGYLGRRDTPEVTLVRLEWAWFGILAHTSHGVPHLQNTLARDPALFVQFLALIFRRDDGKEDPNEVEGDEDRNGLAKQAYQVLLEWEKCPGVLSEARVTPSEEGDIPFHRGEIDAEQLRNWVFEARRIAAEQGRLKVADGQIGEILAYAPADAAGIWPSPTVRTLIEELKNEGIERGFEIATYNRRGTHWRGPGGDQERRLAKKIREQAEHSKTNWLRTNAMLIRIAEGYESDARREDQRHEFEEFED